MKGEQQRLLHLIERLGRLIANSGHAEGLRPVQWEVLRYLALANRFSLKPGAVANYLGTTKGTVSQTLIALEKKALIEKIPDTVDKRSLRLQLTERGRLHIENDPMLQLFSAIEESADSLFTINDVLEGLLITTLRRQGGRAFGICSTCRHFRCNAPEGNPNYCSLLRQPLTVGDSSKICIEQEAA